MKEDRKRNGAMVTRRRMLATVGAPAILCADRRPNILWIIGDDLGVELGCYGFPLVRTPNMDRLANEGVRFTHAFTTAPVCSSSRSAFNVGMYQTTTGTHNHRSHRTDGYRLPGEARLASERFREAGYFTANVLEIASGVRGTGKTDFNFQAPMPFEGSHWNQRAKGQPFFAQINSQAPHKGVAFKAARQQKQLVDPALVPLPPYYPDHPVVRDEFANYLDAVNLLDTQVGATLDVLAADGLLDNTVIFLFGDNGRCLLRGKQWLYDPGTHVPLVIRYPGVLAKGRLRDDPVVALDVAAQSLTYAGIAVPPEFHGRPLFGGPPRDHVFTARDRCDMTVDRIRAVRDRRYKYIRNFMPERPYTQWNQYIENSYPTLKVLQELHAAGKLSATQEQFMTPRRPEVEFYDLQADPHEVRNLAQEPVQKERLARMGRILDGWIRETRDQGVIPEPREVIEQEEPRFIKAFKEGKSAPRLP
ncbi:MAG: sulfatase [Acidobacteriales bacterium]|nr:sulfatase [Terriglobales bacterium]